MNRLPMTTHASENSKGFTAIEVLAVLAIAALLAISLSTFFRQSDSNLKAQTNILKTHIRYAQSRAMNTETLWGVHLDTNQRGYWLFKDPDIDVRITLPGQTTDIVNLGEMGLDITGITFNIVFDGWGRPALTARTFTNGLLTLNLNRSGTDGDDIIITENTGFVP